MWAGGGTVRGLERRARRLDAGVIPFDFHHVMRVFLLHEEAGRGGLRREPVGGDEGPGNVQRRQYVAQPGDLMGFHVDLDWAEDLAGALDHPRQARDRARPRPVGRAPQAFAVDGEDVPHPARFGVPPRVEEDLDGVGRGRRSDAAQGGFARHLVRVAPARTPEAAARCGVQIVNPITDRHIMALAGQHRR